MGIINVTPDSFSDGGLHASTQAAIAHGLQLAEEGADILDIGGESTRPGADYVPVEEELARVIPVIEGLRARTDVLISIDTRKAEVMRQAAAAGADILNDVSALTHDPDAMRVAAESGLPVILMHAQGDPRTMNDNPQYSDVVLDVFDYLEERIAACEAAGIPRAKIVADPGIGFGKHLHHNVAVMAALSLYHALGVPVLLGASRKKLIDHISDVPNPRDRVPGSIAAALAGAAQGMQIIRVHDVAATRQALNVWRAAVARNREGARLIPACRFRFLRGAACNLRKQDLMGVRARTRRNMLDSRRLPCSQARSDQGSLCKQIRGTVSQSCRNDPRGFPCRAGISVLTVFAASPTSRR